MYIESIEGIQNTIRLAQAKTLKMASMFLKKEKIC